MPQTSEPHGLGHHDPGRHGLGVHVVGQRVVVRRVVTGERGPTGGPAMTDVLGTCLSWADGVCVLRTEDGRELSITVADIVSGKPVPPRASVRDRVPPREAQRHGFALFPDLVTRPVGAWVLRDSPTATARRAHSVLAFGPSGVDDDIARVLDFYERPIAAVLRGSPEEARFIALGWVPESHQADTLLQVAGVAQVSRALRGAGASGRSDVAVTEAHPGRWARVRVADRATAYAGFDDDWVGLAGIEVAPAHRRQGLGLAVIEALLTWGSELGAATVFLQVLSDNAPALALYDRLGFRTHHAYRYLTPG